MAKMNKIEQSKNLFGKISNLIEQARKKVAITINQEMVLLYWNVGKTIKEEIIKSKRAEYGKQIVQSLTAQLTQIYGKGFSSQNLWYMVQLYETYPILHALRGEFDKLSWTHVRTILPIKDKLKRQFYSTLCQKERWSTRTLESRIGSMLYERTALSKLPEKTIENQLRELKERDKMTPELVFRDPYVLDFLELSDTYSEKDLEMAILNALEKFIIELGRDFYFVARQKRIILDNIDYYIDAEIKVGHLTADKRGNRDFPKLLMGNFANIENVNPVRGYK